MASEQGPGPPPQDCGKPTEPSASEAGGPGHTGGFLQLRLLPPSAGAGGRGGGCARRPRDGGCGARAQQHHGAGGAAAGHHRRRHQPALRRRVPGHAADAAAHAGECLRVLHQDRLQPVRERHQLGPRGGPAGLRLPPGHPRLPARPDRLPGPGGQLRGQLHAAARHRPVDRAARRLGGSPGPGQRPHPQRAAGPGRGAAGPVCGTKILQVLTPAGAPWDPRDPLPGLRPDPPPLPALPLQGVPESSGFSQRALRFGGPLPGGQSSYRDSQHDVVLTGPPLRAPSLSSRGLPPSPALPAG